MLKNISIQNFRGYKNLVCNELSLINLIVGRNNVGKTTFLEALYLFFGRQNPLLALKVNGDRGLGSIKIGTGSNIESTFNSLFYNFNTSNIIGIVCNDDKKETSLHISIGNSIISEEILNDRSDNILKFEDSKYFQTLNFKNSDDHNPYQLLVTNQGIKINKPGFFENKAYFINSHANSSPKERAELFTAIDTIGKTDELIVALQQIEPRLNKLGLGFIADEPIIMGNIGADRLIPLPLMGDGIVRLFDILIRIINFKNGTILIDEIENGIHHSAQEKIWKAIGMSARRYNVQIFATTHSLECVKNAFIGLSGIQEDLLHVHRIECYEEGTRVKTFGFSKLQTAFDLNLEVR